MVARDLWTSLLLACLVIGACRDFGGDAGAGADGGRGGAAQGGIDSAAHGGAVPTGTEEGGSPSEYGGSITAGSASVVGHGASIGMGGRLQLGGAAGASQQPGRAESGGTSWQDGVNSSGGEAAGEGGLAESGGASQSAGGDSGGNTLYTSWESLPGSARDIGVGADGTAWSIGADTVYGSDDYSIRKWNGSGWDAADGGGIRVAVDPLGIPWIVNSAGQIYRRTVNDARTGFWATIPGSAKDIGIGSDGTVWAIGTTAIGTDFTISKWDGSNWTELVDGGALRIAVGPTGIPWIVNSAGQIYRRSTNSATSGSWFSLPGGAKDIGVGPENYAWIIGSTSIGKGGYGIYLWDQRSEVLGDTVIAGQWLSLAGAGSQISVGPNGRPWIVDATGDIYRARR